MNATLPPDSIPAAECTCPANSVRFAPEPGIPAARGSETFQPDPLLKSPPSEPVALPDPAMLRKTLQRMEIAWLAGKSTAPDDDIATALVQRLVVTPLMLAGITAGRSPVFRAALLTRGTSRLWTAGPPQ